MKARKRAGTVGKVLGCALLLVIALFPIYWLVAMAIRPTSEMQGHISLIPQSLTIEHFISLFVSKGFGQAAINSLQTTLSSLALSVLNTEDNLTNFGLVAAGGVVSVIPITLFVIFAQNYLISGLSSGAVKE